MNWKPVSQAPYYKGPVVVWFEDDVDGHYWRAAWYSPEKGYYVGDAIAQPDYWCDVYAEPPIDDY